MFEAVKRMSFEAFCIRFYDVLKSDKLNCLGISESELTNIAFLFY